MKLENLDKQALIQQIEELERLNEQLLKEQEQETRLTFDWTHNLGHWYWDYPANKVTFDSMKVAALGYAEDEIPKDVNYQFFTDRLHPDDYDMTMQAMADHLSGKKPIYEVEYRIRTKNGDYRWYYDRGAITKRDDKGKPLFLAGIVFDITEKKELQIELENKNKILAEQTSTDYLTRLKNHRSAYDTLRTFLEKQEPNISLCVAMLDLDDFKKVNDTHGHIQGDQVLFEIANIMRRNTRKKDIIARYGGEEFLIIFPETTGRDAYKVCERIRMAIEDKYQRQKVNLTISCGIHVYDGGSASDFVHAADVKMYQAKHAGKNQTVL